MKKHEYNDDKDMIFSPAEGWQLDISLPPNAQITEIHLRIYSFTYPENVYAISWGKMQRNTRQLLIPICAAAPDNSGPDEAVRLAFDITYYTS